MDEILKLITKFRDDREWKQFHTPKNLASALSIEAAELNEIFLWKKDDECYNVNKEKVSEELADVLIYSLLMLDTFDLDFYKIIKQKLIKNNINYPVAKAKGTAKKYNEL